MATVVRARKAGEDDTTVCYEYGFGAGYDSKLVLDRATGELVHPDSRDGLAGRLHRKIRAAWRATGVFPDAVTFTSR